MQDYWFDILLALDDLAEKRRRKGAVIALLSHWQTLICSQIQLADHQLAHRYRCVTQKSPPASKAATLEANPLEEANALSPLLGPKDLFADSAGKLAHSTANHSDLLYDTARSSSEERSGSGALHASLLEQGAGPGPGRSTPIPPTPQRSAVQTHRRQGSNATVTGFQAGHRRGASTATQATISGQPGTSTATAEAQQPKKEDLYHWILRAQKEYKQRREQQQQPKTEPDLGLEVNPMELALPVFFWAIYERRELEPRPPALCAGSTSANLVCQWQSLKLDVFEKRALTSANEETRMTFTCHHLAALESLELRGLLKYGVTMDQTGIAPVL